MNRDVCEHFVPKQLPCDRCDVENKSLKRALARVRVSAEKLGKLVAEWNSKFGSGAKEKPEA
jgi:hypothetical protein